MPITHPIRQLAAAVSITALALFSCAAPSAPHIQSNPMPVQTSITGVTTDLLMSDDMADYLATLGTGQQADDGDME